MLRSERARVLALAGAFGALFVLVLVRGGVSLAQGHRGEAWPFAVLLGLMTVYEVLWHRFVTRAIESGREISTGAWRSSIAVESALPAFVLILQANSTYFGPQAALTSPAILTFSLFILLSTLHLTPELSRLAGVLSAAGYAAAAGYIFFRFPEVAAQNLAYLTAFSCVVFLLVCGLAAGAVARQIRMQVEAALHESENRVRLERDLQVAQTIQQGLLPSKPPDIPGFDIAGWNKPADETGGDYFDWQHLGDGRLAITLADVTGHGIGSALCMAACRSYARAGFATERDLHPFLLRLNQLLYEDLPSAKFVTLAAGMLTPGDSTLRLISAGHGPLLFYSAEQDSFQSWDAHGVPLGMIPRAAYGPPEEIRFAAGDILILVTDGFLEWTNAQDDDFGEARLREVVRSCRNRSAADIISELYDRVLKFANSTPQLDDLTALVLKRL
jgi:serine phosphatase RsbU (regulator of sigma subunit)